MGELKCITCKYFVKAESISMISRMMGYTAECSKVGTLFNIESLQVEPLWCPLRKKNEMEEKL